MSDETAPLSAQDTARLNEFARACKAAARCVLLYPASHPTSAAALNRIAHLTAGGQPLKLTVLPHSLRLDGREPARVDEAVSELADLLHTHLVGEMIVQPGGDPGAWRDFLTLLGRSADSVRGEGGIARLWMTTGARHVELREIDYAEVLRERTSGHAAAWDRIVTDCLQGSVSLDDEAVEALIAAAADPERINELVAALEEKASAGGIRARAAALVRLLKTLVGAVARTAPEQVDNTLQNLATAMTLVSPDVVFELLAQQRAETEGEEPRLLSEIARQMPEQTAARILARSLIAEGAATERLARAFHALVPETDRRERMLSLTRTELSAAASDAPDLESLWTNVVELVTSYSDSTYVSDAYGRELSGARGQAIQVEQVSDDPPERLSSWLGTIRTSAVRALDLALLLDLLSIENDARRWRALMEPVVAQIEDLLLVADFEAADRLIAAIAREAGPEGDAARTPGALHAIDRLVAGPTMRHIVSHLATIDDIQFDRVKQIALAIGSVLVQPLAEALSNEERARTRERLTTMLIAFGPTGRQTVERLRNSPNPVVRRTAVYLLREFGGSDALPDLTLLLDDAEPQVQREAVRAILNIGSDAAYGVLQQALASGSERSQEAIMQAIALVRDERATPLFSYILRHVDHRGPLRRVYQRAIESLGALRDPDAVEPLKEALYRGEWWAPFRTAALRTSAADALARIGTPDAIAVLEAAAESGTRTLRKVVRRPLTRATATRQTKV